MNNLKEICERVTDIPMNRNVMRRLCCPHCGVFLLKIDFWSCPYLHGKLFCESTLAESLTIDFDERMEQIYGGRGLDAAYLLLELFYREQKNYEGQ